MLRRAISILDDAKKRSGKLKARAYALAPWTVNDAVADRRPEHDGSARPDAGTP